MRIRCAMSFNPHIPCIPLNLTVQFWKHMWPLRLYPSTACLVRRFSVNASVGIISPPPPPHHPCNHTPRLEFPLGINTSACQGRVRVIYLAHYFQCFGLRKIASGDLSTFVHLSNSTRNVLRW
ncbi:hypothetical protein K443DRAFT_464079 [Laccaria amethystina LaAM-08-1]|uniref:Uncharacterized protein n=1 Tax=Laccaria amethystina LaAM-08-1 TaxID=1095629 RepID=A0A0C9WU68_9AGAR|nr:hypothetical protein K443DRAFT_464079 [Laccaria amethystina LaAM-08-1]